MSEINQDGESRRDYQELLEELCFYKEALRSLPNPIFIKNESAKFVFFNRAYDKFFEVESDALLGTTVDQSVHLDEKDKFRYHVEDTTLLQTGSTTNYEVPFTRSNNEVVPSLYWSCGFKTDDGQRGLVGEVVSVSNLRKIENSLISSVVVKNPNDGQHPDKQFGNQLRQFFRTILNYYDAERILVFDLDRIQSQIRNVINVDRDDDFHDITTNYDDVDLKGIFEYIKNLSPNSVKALSKEQLQTSSVRKYFEHLDTVIIAPLSSNDGNAIGLMVVENPTLNLEKLEIIQSTTPFIVTDLSKSKVYEKILKLNMTDSLTNLYNRNKYNDVLNLLTAQKPKTLGIVVTDVNGLKAINDYYGEHNGDAVLCNIAEMLKEIFGEYTFRVGDDEFICLCPEITQQRFERSTQSLKKSVDGNEFCHLSFGYVLANGDFEINKRIAYANELLMIEKQAYYKNLKNGQIKIAKYSHDIAKSLLNDLSQGKFRVFLQPQIDLESGKVVGAEALIRKVDFNGNIIPPIKFLPLYEKEKIIRHVDIFVISTVCQTLNRWHKQGIKLKIAVNLSRVTLMERDIISEISYICDTSGVGRESIELEVTETSNSIDDMHLMEILKEAQQSGFCVSLDDFGAEYSNLRMLTSMEFSKIKFDKSLIDKICTDLRSSTIVEYAIKMCKSLGIGDLLAEGIETSQQMEQLKEIDCKSGQGYYFSKPIPIEEFEKRYLK